MDIENMQRLVDTLNDANYKYYTLGTSTISDKEYDALYDQLLAFEQQSGMVLPNSPSQRVGDEIIGDFKKYIHEVPMYSLEKCTSIEILGEWCKKIMDKFNDARFSVEYKFDGLSLVIEYNNGHLVRAGTRGNGTIGEDVTAQVKTIKNIPLSIKYKGKVIVQGEVVMTWSAFHNYNKTAIEKLKNPRNAAAGALRNLDPKVTASRNLSAFFYSIQYIDGGVESQADAMLFLQENHFPMQNNYIFATNLESILENIKSIDSSKTSLDFLIDGAVVKLDNYDGREILGFTAKHPKWAIAYKFEAEETTTILEDVIWQIGRTGKLTPIAKLVPVELAGATISRATLNNVGDIQRKNVFINSRVFIRRSNEVIPEIMGLAEKYDDSVAIVPPNVCPSCGEPLTKKGAHIFCTNVRHCPEQIIDRLTHFAGRDAMNIEGLSDKTIMLLNDKLDIAFPYQLYTLNEENLISLPQFKDKKVSNLLQSIEKSKTVDFASFIFALGIQNIGKKSAFMLAKTFDNLDMLINSSTDTLNNISDFGAIMAESVVEYFAEDDNINNIKKLIESGVTIKYVDTTLQSEFFRNKKIVLTGSLENYERSELTKILQLKGADVLSTVSKKTDFVIVGMTAGSKLEKAKKLNIAIITENELDSWLNQ